MIESGFGVTCIISEGGATWVIWQGSPMQYAGGIICTTFNLGDLI